MFYIKLFFTISMIIYVYSECHNTHCQSICENFTNYTINRDIQSKCILNECNCFVNNTIAKINDESCVDTCTKKYNNDYYESETNNSSCKCIRKINYCIPNFCKSSCISQYQQGIYQCQINNNNYCACFSADNCDDICKRFYKNGGIVDNYCIECLTKLN